MISPFTVMAKRQKELSDTKSEGTVATDAAPAMKRQPIKTLRIEDCSASIWVREAQIRGELQKFYSVSFERSYKDRDGSWKYTKSFDFDSLGKIVQLCQMAQEEIQSLR